jgi:hypothetical protein
MYIEANMVFLSTLGPFQKNVVIVACIVLIVVLGVIGYFLSKGSSERSWPPNISNCPDYWEDQEGDGTKCFNTQRLGKCGIGPYDLTGWTKPARACENSKIMERCALTWDGITSGDVCSESYEQRARDAGTWN